MEAQPLAHHARHLRVPLAGDREQVRGEGLEHVRAREGREGAARVSQQQHDTLAEGMALAVEEEARLQPYAAQAVTICIQAATLHEATTVQAAAASLRPYEEEAEVMRHVNGCYYYNCYYCYCYYYYCYCCNC